MMKGKRKLGRLDWDIETKPISSTCTWTWASDTMTWTPKCNALYTQKYNNNKGTGWLNTGTRRGCELS